MTYHEITKALENAEIENYRAEAAMLICRFCSINQAELLLRRDEDFDSPELENAVIQRISHYPLQYILYTSAFMQFLELHLDRKITEEDFDRYFGGVYYFFLRGISPQFPERGIFYDRPSFRLIQKINTIFG